MVMKLLQKMSAQATSHIRTALGISTLMKQHPALRDGNSTGTNQI
jgi:hypothetical protein